MKIAATLIPVFILCGIIGFSVGTDFSIPTSNPIGPPPGTGHFAGDQNNDNQPIDPGVSAAVADETVSPQDSCDTNQELCFAKLDR